MDGRDRGVHGAEDALPLAAAAGIHQRHQGFERRAAARVGAGGGAGGYLFLVERRSLSGQLIQTDAPCAEASWTILGRFRLIEPARQRSAAGLQSRPGIFKSDLLPAGTGSAAQIRLRWLFSARSSGCSASSPGT